MEMLKQTLNATALLFFFYQAVSAGYDGTYDKGSYFLLWIIVIVNLSIITEDEE